MVLICITTYLATAPDALPFGGLNLSKAGTVAAVRESQRLIGFAPFLSATAVRGLSRCGLLATCSARR